MEKGNETMSTATKVGLILVGLTIVATLITAVPGFLALRQSKALVLYEERSSETLYATDTDKARIKQLLEKENLPDASTTLYVSNRGTAKAGEIRISLKVPGIIVGKKTVPDLGELPPWVNISEPTIIATDPSRVNYTLENLAVGPVLQVDVSYRKTEQKECNWVVFADGVSATSVSSLPDEPTQKNTPWYKISAIVFVAGGLLTLVVVLVLRRRDPLFSRSKGKQELGRKPETPPKKDESMEDSVIPKISTPASTDKESTVEDNWVEALGRKEYDKSIQLLEQQIAETSDANKKVEFKSVIGYVKYEEDQAEGITYFEKLISEFEYHPGPYRWLSSIYSWDELYEKALVAARRGLAKVENKSDLRDSEAKFLSKLGRFEEAISVLDQGIQNDPSYVGFYIHQAEIFIQLEKKESARLSLKRGFEICPKSETLLDRYGAFLLDNKENNDGLLIYRKLAVLFPDNAKYQALLGNVYLAHSLNDMALNAYEKANDLTRSQEAWILANIGNLYSNRGLYSLAIKYLKMALEIYPDYEYAHNRLASALKNQDEEEKQVDDILEQARKVSANKERSINTNMNTRAEKD